MTRRADAGFTLVELIVAVFLASIVLLALTSILTPLVTTAVNSSRAQTVQLNLATVDKLLWRQLRTATLVTAPSLPGIPSGVLEGCANAYAQPAGGPAPIDPSAGMSSFAFCSANGIVYFHQQAGCPIVYTCGTAPAAEFVWGPEPWSALSFTRPSAASTLITADMKASSQQAAAEIVDAVAFSAPAGGAQ